jgi:non-heme chloroperoxidase
MSTVDLNGVRLEYVEQGQGDPLVLVHGSLCDFRYWHFQMEPFSQKYRTIAYSRRYHYPNVWVGDGRDYSAKLHAEDLAAILRGLGLGPVHLVAASYGAYTALFLSIKYPTLVQKLVLAEPPILQWLQNIPGAPPLAAKFIKNAWEPARQAFGSGDLEKGVRLFVSGVVGQGAFDTLPPPVQHMMLDNAEEMKAETLAPDYLPSLTREEVGQIQAPTLLLTGEHSPKMFLLIMDELERFLPNNERRTIPDASHALAAGNPKAYNQTVLAFLAKE